MAGLGRGFLAHFWDAPYRPLFLSAYLWALICILIWPIGETLGLGAPAFGPPVMWHAHEMLFGFAALAKGGYLLSALPGWTGCAPIVGWRLKMLFGFWACSRGLIFFADPLPLALLLIVNACYFLFLAWILLSRIVAARTYERLPFGIAVLVMGTLEAGFVATAQLGMPWVSLELIRAAVLVLSLLMIAIGARAIPAFTSNWLRSVGADVLPTAPMYLRQLPVGVVMAALVSLVLGQQTAGFALLIAGAVAVLSMMRGWRSAAALRNPLLAGLHVSYLFLALGLAAVGILGLMQFPYPLVDALHAVTMGAAAGLIMAISGRAGAHQPDGSMRASWGFTVGVGLIWCATLVRLAVPLVAAYDDALLAASLIWVLGWAVFIYGYRSALAGQPKRPAFSGKSLL